MKYHVSYGIFYKYFKRYLSLNIPSLFLPVTVWSYWVVLPPKEPSGVEEVDKSVYVVPSEANRGLVWLKQKYKDGLFLYTIKLYQQKLQYNV